MANRKELPREKRLKEENNKLHNEVMTLKTDKLELLRVLKERNENIEQLIYKIQRLEEERADLADFKHLTRLALPYLERRREYQAINTSNYK